MRVRCCLAGAMLAGALAARSAEPIPSAAAAAKPEPHVRRGADGDTVISLDLATQQIMGLKTAPLEAVRVNPEIKGYGRVLDASSLMSIVADLVPAQAARDASQAELKRLRILAAQNNASERALQAADAAAKRDQAQVDAGQLRLLAAWGAAIASREDLPAFARSLGALEAALVQVDLPAGASLEAQPTGARLLTLAGESQPLPAKWLGPAPAADPLSQGRGFLFVVAPNPAHLVPGQAVTGWLSLPGGTETGIAVPRGAVLRYNGAAWIYLQTGDTTFQRKEVLLDRPLTEAWFVPNALKPGDKVVVIGAQQMLSEELKGRGEAEN